MDDSSISPLLLSSSTHLENVEQLIKNLEKQTLDLNNFEDIVNNRGRQEIITKSFSAVSVNDMTIDDDALEDNFLVKSISLANNGASMIMDGNVSTDSLFNQRDLFDTDDYKKQQTPPVLDQSLFADQESNFTWDDQYDTRANYRLTFSTNKKQQQQQIESKTGKSHRSKHHRHKHRTNDSQADSMCSDDGLPPNVTSHMADWSMRSSTLTACDQSMDQSTDKTVVDAQQQSFNFVRSQSHPTTFATSPATPMNNNSPNSSSTSSSSSASWRRNKENPRTTSTTETKDIRPPSPLSLYKIFQQKTQMAGSSSQRSAFQYYRQQTDSIVPNMNESMTISGEKLQSDKSRTLHYQKKPLNNDRRSSQTTSASTDQAIQTSIIIDPTSSSSLQQSLRPTPKSESYDHLASHVTSNSPHHLVVPSRPSPAPISSSTVHKSLPDLAFISQYSKELPRSRTVSPSLTASNAINNPSPSPSPVVIQTKLESDRPRTLKSIKRYKNSKHSTEPLNVFYSPQLRKTFAAVPASAIIPGTDEAPTMIKMKLPTSSSQATLQPAANLKSCLKYGSRANSCDIQAMLDERKSPAPSFTLPQSEYNRDSISPASKRRCSETDAPLKRPEQIYPARAQTPATSNAVDSFGLRDLTRDHYSDYDLAFMLQQQQQQQNQAKKSVSFSENIAKHLISPCNPAIKFDFVSEARIDDDNEPPQVNERDLTYALHGNREVSTRKPTARYGEMRRCQTDVIVVDRIHHLHSFTESPPNEFRLQETDSLLVDTEDDDDQAIMEKAHVNIVPEMKESKKIDLSPISINAAVSSNKMNTVENTTPFNDKENQVPQASPAMNSSTTTMISIDDPSLEGLFERVASTVKRIFDIKRSEKAFFLANNQNTPLDTLLKDELCVHLQQILEHGRKSQGKDLNMTKTVSLWELIETSISHGKAKLIITTKQTLCHNEFSGSSLQVFHEAKQAAQNASNYLAYKFQAFIFALLNKNELINWLYYFTKQKDVLVRHYNSPEALILGKTESTFNLFDRIMVQLEKLTALAFRLVYSAPTAIPNQFEEQLATSHANENTNRSNSRDWMRTISRRTTKTVTQPIVHTSNVQPTPAAPPSAAAATTNDTFRSTFTRKINSLFTKTPAAQPQRKNSSAVTAKLPNSKPTAVQASSPTVTHRPRSSNVFANTSATAAKAVTITGKPVIVASPKPSNGPRSSSIRRAISPSVVVAPSPPPTLNTPSTTTNTANSTFQSKIPRPSLNVDKPKSARYRSTALPPK